MKFDAGVSLESGLYFLHHDPKLHSAPPSQIPHALSTQERAFRPPHRPLATSTSQESGWSELSKQGNRKAAEPKAIVCADAPPHSTSRSRAPKLPVSELCFWRRSGSILRSKCGSLRPICFCKRRLLCVMCETSWENALAALVQCLVFAILRGGERTVTQGLTRLRPRRKKQTKAPRLRGKPRDTWGG